MSYQKGNKLHFFLFKELEKAYAKSNIINFPQEWQLPYWKRKWRHIVCSG